MHELDGRNIAKKRMNRMPTAQTTNYVYSYQNLSTMYVISADLDELLVKINMPISDQVSQAFAPIDAP